LLLAVLWFALRLEPVSARLQPRQAAALALLGAAAALWLEPVFTTLGYGQIDLLIVALIVFDLSLPDAARAKGVWIGLAAGLKLTPIIFALYLLLTNRRRPAARALVSFGATIALGFALVPRDAGRYWGGLLFDSSRVGRLENSANQSLRGALARMLHTVDVQAWWLVVAALVAAAGIALAVIACRRGDEATGFSLCAITGLLVSPVSWTHHWVLAVPALMLLGVTTYRQSSRAGLLAALAIAAIGYSHMTWWVRPGAASELHLGFAGLLYGNAYVLTGLAALAIGAWAAAGHGPVHQSLNRRHYRA
jgi:alpha-1,2-mannosyltransferase